MNDFRKRLLNELGLALILIAALSIGVIFFRTSIKETSEKIAVTRRNLTERSNTVESLINLRKQYTSAQNYLNFLHGIIPLKDQLINLSREFQVLAAQDGLGLGFSFTGENAASPPNLGSVGFKLTVKSNDLDKLLNFVQRLQSFKYLSSVDNVSIKKLESEFEIDISGRIFFR